VGYVNSVGVTGDHEELVGSVNCLVVTENGEALVGYVYFLDFT
jgi:hypothetical protein